MINPPLTLNSAPRACRNKGNHSYTRPQVRYTKHIVHAICIHALHNLAISKRQQALLRAAMAVCQTLYLHRNDANNIEVT